MTTITLNKLLILSLFVLVGLSRINVFAPPDWNKAYDAILAKDLDGLESFADEVIAGPWECQRKFTFLSCLMGRIYSFNAAARKEYEFQLLPVPQDLAELQKIYREVNSNIKDQRQIMNITGEILKDVLAKQIQLQRTSESETDQIVDELIFSANSLINEGLNNQFLNRPRYTYESVLENEEDRLLRDQLVKQSEDKIREIQAENRAIDEQIARLVQQKEGNLKKIENQRQKILQVQAVFLKQRSKPKDKDQKIQAFIDDMVNDLQKTISDAKNKIQQIRILQVSIIKYVGPLEGFGDLFVKVEKAQFDCYFVRANSINFDGNTVQSQMTANTLKLYLYKSLGPGSYETVDDFINFPADLKFMNFFSDEWRNKYGQTLVESIADPECCVVDVYNFRSGRIKAINGNQMTVQFTTGKQMVLTMNVCSRVYQLTPQFDRILFISQPFADLNKVYNALLYGDGAVPV